MVSYSVPEDGHRREKKKGKKVPACDLVALIYLFIYFVCRGKRRCPSLEFMARSRGLDGNSTTTDQ